MAMNEATLIQRLQSLAPFGDASHARRAFDATLSALRSGLNDDESDWLSVDLGEALAAPLQRQSHVGELSRDQFYRQMARHTGLRRSLAIEQAQVVCRALAELLPAPGLQRLKKHLPRLAELFSVPAPPEHVAAPHHEPAEALDHTLAGGKPGSERPLSEAGGPSDQAFSGATEGPAHTHSVAQGLPEERGGEPISTARRASK